MWRWSPRQLDSLITFLDLWRPLLPVWILENVLEQIVLPKLQVEIKLKSFISLILSGFFLISGRGGIMETSDWLDFYPFLAASSGEQTGDILSHYKKINWQMTSTVGTPITDLPSSYFFHGRMCLQGDPCRYHSFYLNMGMEGIYL